MNSIYVNNETIEIIEVMLIRKKESEAAVCYSTMYQNETKDLTDCTGQFGWMSKKQLKQAFTKMGEL